MNRRQYIIASSNLPFDIDPFDPDFDVLLNAVPRTLMAKLGNAKSHGDEVLAGDKIAAWIEHNWRHILPDISARFPVK